MQIAQAQGHANAKDNIRKNKHPYVLTVRSAEAICDDHPDRTYSLCVFHDAGGANKDKDILNSSEAAECLCVRLLLFFCTHPFIV